MSKRKRMISMWIGVCIMGIMVAILKMCHLGTDPCVAFCYGLAGKIGTGLGVCQMTFNIILFIGVFFYDRKLLGWGTFANMFFVGYVADATTWVMEHGLGISTEWSMTMRIGIMIPALCIFVIAAAVYMGAGLGTAPYDAFAFLIADVLKKHAKKKIPFWLIRMVYDAFFMIIGYLIGGESGLVTLFMIFTLGPVVQKVRGLICGIK